MQIHKRKEELTCKTYLDIVDELRNDEECHFLVEMNFLEDLVVIVPQPVTLAPPSTCQIREKSNDHTNERDLQNTEKKGNKKLLRTRYSLIQTTRSRDEGELPHKNALSLLARLLFLQMGWIKKKCKMYPE